MAQYNSKFQTISEYLYLLEIKEQIFSTIFMMIKTSFINLEGPIFFNTLKTHSAFSFTDDAHIFAMSLSLNQFNIQNAIDALEVR
jgi:hypothetical protein